MERAPLRIVFAADIHHAFAALGDLLELTRADLYLLGGDLVYRAFHRYDTAWRFMELQQILGSRRTNGEAKEPLITSARRWARDRRDPSLAAQAAEYVALCQRAESYLLNSYKRMERALSARPGKRVHLIPGNYDTDLTGTALQDRDLHLKALDLRGWRIAGYGGARVKTPGLPDHLQVPFIEAWVGGALRSQPLDFFRRVRPDILVVHEPPYGFLDRPVGHDHSGSSGIREYVDEAAVRLVLSGHYHEDWGAAHSNGTSFFNPSSFGSTVEVSGGEATSSTSSSASRASPWAPFASWRNESSSTSQTTGSPRGGFRP
jgi:Icc-related predicted phosphoesterase